MERLEYELNEIGDAARWLLAHSRPGPVCIEGPMGAGKTTLVKAVLAALGSLDPGNSPTFGLVAEHVGAEGEPLAYHMDLYRVERLEELYGIGFEEYLDQGVYTFIEWPEIAAPLLPEDVQRFRLSSVTGKEAVRTLEKVI